MSFRTEPSNRPLVDLLLKQIVTIIHSISDFLFCPQKKKSKIWFKVLSLEIRGSSMRSNAYFAPLCTHVVHYDYGTITFMYLRPCSLNAVMNETELISWVCFGTRTC